MNRKALFFVLIDVPFEVMPETRYENIRGQQVMGLKITWTSVIFFFILSSLSVCLAEPPNPKIWEPLQYNSFYNKKIITKSPGILLVWTYRTITDEARENRIEEVKRYAPEKSIKYKQYHHETVLWEMNCANRRIRMEEIIDFDKNGKVLDRHQYDHPEWVSIIPKSGAERLYQNVCVRLKTQSPKK
ncbi:MAG TPA: hypothetical protein PKO04_07105 [Smithellaceae bacterium]|nr:hypothetical protein [Smithellaceae bacterium]